MEAKRKTPTVETKGGARIRKNREGQMEFHKDLCAISKNFRDLSVKYKFHINLKP
jgi:hypothetical protein